MDGQKVVKVFCHEEENFEGFKKLNDALRESAYSANRISNTIMPLTMAMGNLSYVLCAVVGGLLATNGYLGLTIGTLVSFLTLNKSFNQPINQVSQRSMPSSWHWRARSASLPCWMKSRRWTTAM